MDLQKITINSSETYNTIHATSQLNQDRTLNYKEMIREIEKQIKSGNRRYRPPNNKWATDHPYYQELDDIKHYIEQSEKEIQNVYGERIS
jgi:hypothetical protein